MIKPRSIGYYYAEFYNGLEINIKILFKTRIP
ncbi:hypothetical protein DFQ11_101181 [Winogradskyella epiphytica]|uniref:Uncharacterized protein n=1 Tax=Winogradskyella epiphytica TaxID=262005 RepID=A0A2V4WYM3_9FLAO|nr:hypothetical protein DFQ11_101181 [Winogradskyella epiphytica]